MMLSTHRPVWPRGLAGLLAVLTVLALFVIGAADLVQHYRLGAQLAVVLTMARLLPVALVWSRPSAAAVLATLTSAATAPVLTPVSPAEPWPWPITTTAIWALVLVVAGSRIVKPARRRATLAGAWAGLQVAGVIGWLALGRGQLVSGLIVPGVVTAVAVVLGEMVGARMQMARDITRQRAESAAERDRRAQLEERARIARELHDVVAHHLSVVVARADSAALRLAPVPEAVQQELGAIAEQARTSLNEMRRVLHLLRAQEGEPGSPLGPQPGLEDIGDLLDQARQAGVRVELAGPMPTAQTVPPTVQLTAFRVVQEALSNTLRHAPGAPVTVQVQHRHGRLEVRVVNGRATAPPKPSGSGYGLRGIRERVVAAGGTEQVEPTSDGGFRVSVSIPTRGE